MVLHHLAIAAAFSQPCPAVYAKQAAPTLIDANPSSGFYSPYFMFVPDRVQRDTRSTLRFLVVPNNSGVASDDPQVFFKDSLKTACEWERAATSLGVGVFVPVFPRPADDLLYTHALTRATLVTNDPKLRRPDLQLIAMLDDAIGRQATAGLHFDSRVLMWGFSASGSFVNRFVFLHPDKVLAAAYGSPGGWAIAPLSSYKGSKLRYPVGVADFDQLTGQSFDLAAVAKVPQFLFMGTEDNNDAVIYDDSFDSGARVKIFTLFGPTLIARWHFTKTFYGQLLPKAILKLYPGVGHDYSKAMNDDVMAFFARWTSRKRAL